MTHYDITASSNAQLQIADGDSVTVEAGIVINNPDTADQYGRFAIYDPHGAGNNVEVFGKVKAFVGVYLLGGGNTIDVAASGTAAGSNACVEMYLGGNTVTNEGLMQGAAWGAYFGPSPTYDPFLDGAGHDSFTNSGTVSTSRQPGIRMVEGGNTITNSGTITTVKVEAIRIQSRTTDAANTIDNSGTITGGNGVAITTGDASTHITNSNTITGAILFGAGDDFYSATDHVGATINGGAGNDTISGGFGADTITGGLGLDKMAGGGGHDNFVFNAVAESTGKLAQVDVITHFEFNKDTITANGTAVTSFDHITSVSQLEAGHAAIMQGPHGGDTYYLVIDENGVAGYQAGADYEIQLKAPLHLPA